ncbi:MAG: YdiU family protein [Pseudomonadota bacterium]
MVDSAAHAEDSHRDGGGPRLFPFDNSYARLPERFHVKLNPTPVKQPGWLAFNADLATYLGLDATALQTDAGLQVFAGNAVAEGSDPLAMAYAGQQFGNWNPQLGDGRAHLLGEIIAPDGLRYDIQLKGSGPTPFSRMGDGRAWIGPVIREYIVSEAMAVLGVPTTRALAAVSTGESIFRESVLPGGVLTRVSRGHIRVGTFQYFAARQDEEALRLLALHCLERFYPDRAQDPAQSIDADAFPGAALLEAVVEAQAKLIARWMALGFIHGVMNTDNMSIAGETIDYGPCAFLDGYDPGKVFSSIDEMGRYAYGNQPRIGHWNLVQLAQALLPLMGKSEEQAVATAQEIVNRYPDISQTALRSHFAAKIGLSDGPPEVAKAQADQLLSLMGETKADFTNTFRALSNSDGAFLEETNGDPKAQEWLAQWHAALANNEADVQATRSAMRQVNPKYIPRNHRIEETIAAGLEGDLGPFKRLSETLATPFEDQPQNNHLAQPPTQKEEVRATFCGT